MLTQLRQHHLDMLLVLISRLAEDKDVVNEHNRKLRELMLGVQATISIKLGRIEHVIHHTLKGSWCIGQAKGKHPELVVTNRSPECSFGLILIL